MRNNNKILFTRKLSSEQRSYADGLHIDDYSFISIEYSSYTPSVEEGEIPFVIFPSQNAVIAVKDSFIPRKNQIIYTVGHKTANMLNSLWHNEIHISESENAKGIIELIKKEKADNFLYFCGKRRLHTMENFFREEDKKYKLIEAYNTLNTPKEGLATSEYDILCFCSPSAVDSYLSLYEIDDNQQVISIGETTAAVLRSYSRNVYTAKKASVEAMLDYLKIL